VPDDLTKALLVEEAAPPRAIAEALFASVTGRVPLLQALIDAGAVTPPVLARYLARTDEPQLQRVVPVPDLVDRLPPGLCARLLAIPVRRDAITGTIDVAVADPADPHPAEEIAFHLGSLQRARHPGARRGDRGRAPSRAHAVDPAGATDAVGGPSVAARALRSTRRSPAQHAALGHAEPAGIRVAGEHELGHPDPADATRLRQSARGDTAAPAARGPRRQARQGLLDRARRGFQGWSCTMEFGDRTQLQSVQIPLDTETVFDAAVKDGMYLGPLPNDDAHRRLVGFMRGASRDVAVTPVRVSGKTAVVIVADGLGDTMIATRRLDEIARTAGDAFTRIVRAKR
jgi:hypothetical protein